MNRINRLFQQKSTGILSIYFTAGYPAIDSAPAIIKLLAGAGVDMIEIGMPFSDPMADGPVIQASSTRALKNGMSLKLLFNQLKNIRKETDIPLLLMGYLNPVMQFGITRFCEHCSATGIDGVILPDLPPDIYRNEYHAAFKKYDLHNIFLISPQISEKRIRIIDKLSSGFIYMVSSSSTTGIRGGFTAEQTTYFERIRNMKLMNPQLIGFGISDHESFTTACQYALGTIIGSAFVKMLGEKGFSEPVINDFIREIRGV